MSRKGYFMLRRDVIRVTDLRNNLKKDEALVRLMSQGGFVKDVIDKKIRKRFPELEISEILKETKIGPDMWPVAELVVRADETCLKCINKSKLDSLSDEDRARYIRTSIFFQKNCKDFTPIWQDWKIGKRMDKLLRSQNLLEQCILDAYGRKVGKKEIVRFVGSICEEGMDTELIEAIVDFIIERANELDIESEIFWDKCEKYAKEGRF